MFNYDADLQINEADMVQPLDPCLPDIWLRFLGKVKKKNTFLVPARFIF